ncbi:MAG: universal stress protein [Rhodospirillaceae bacterium]
MQLIMAATDGSEAADRAIDMAATLAKASAARLVVIAVGDQAEDKADIARLARAEGGIGEALDLVTNTILQQAKQRASRHGVPSVDDQQCGGDPAETIIETARRLRVDVIVVGRRGRGRIAGLLLGSVSQKLVSLAPCAVMVVP